jgi:transcriptional regulator with XRE-family HTH domain
MKSAKKKRLELKGWKVGTVAEFLRLSPEESAYIEMKLALSKNLQEHRKDKSLTQKQLARLLKSSQSRVAKMEAGNPSVSLDLLVRSLLILSESRKGLAKILSQPHSAFLRTLEETQGVWSDKNHPDLKTARDMEQFVSDKRQSYRKRLKVSR